MEVNSALIVCTRNRSRYVEGLLKNLERCTVLPRLILIVDSSDDDHTRNLILGFECSNFSVIYIKSPRGLPYQRNEGLKALRTESLDFISFLDDDVRIPPNYFQLIREIFNLEKDAIGITGVMEGIKQPKPKIFHRIFFLGSVTPGKILKSGQTTMPFALGEVSKTEWLPGGAMNYRSYLFSKLLFNDSIRMYGEDIEFSLRSIQVGGLLVARQLTYKHLGATAGKENDRKAVQYSAAIRYWLAGEYPKAISKVAVLFSVIGITLANVFNILILRNVRYNLNCLLGHLAFFNMIIIGRDLKQNF